METIRNYLDTMFQNLPASPELRRLKEDLLANMEDKYQELKENGASENEAVGRVISEFGNIDELLNELGLSPDGMEQEAKYQEECPPMSVEEVQKYIEDTQKEGRYVGFGVTLILFGVSLLIFLSLLFEIRIFGIGVPATIRSFLPMICFFLFLVPAVGLFVHSGMKMERYKYIEQGEFSLPSITRNTLMAEVEEIKDANRIFILAGVLLCVISPVLLFIAGLFGGYATGFGVCVMLIVIAAGVNLLITAGTREEAYTKLLKMDNYAMAHKRQNKIIGAVASVIWPLTVVAFLIAGFVFGAWGKAWVLFPIVGILFGAFSAACQGTSGKK